MATEPNVSPGNETENLPVPGSDEDPNLVAEVTQDGKPAESEAPTEDPKAEPAKKSDVEIALEKMQRRIDKQTAKVHHERGRAEALAQKVAELEARTGTTEPTADTSNPVALAREIARIERFNEKANAIVTAGKEAHSDYLSTIRDLASEVGEFVKQNGAPSNFMEVVLEVADKPDELMYYLGKNPDIAGDLADLNPIQLAKKLDRIQRDLTDSSKPKTSNAPKPLAPVKATGASIKDPANMSDKEFAAWRRAQIAARR